MLTNVERICLPYVRRSSYCHFLLAFAALLGSVDQAQANTVETSPPNPEGTPVLISGDTKVQVYELPDAYKQVLLSGSKIYAIEYSMYSAPDDAEAASLPGISVGKWYEINEETGKFFPWRDDVNLAKDLSSQSQQFLLRKSPDLLDSEGNLKLYSYANGGGFVFGNWSNNNPPEGFINRPTNKSKSGLQYYYDGIGYYTGGGNKGVGRIQAYGGCEANIISSGKSPDTSDIVESGFCAWESETNQVLSSKYAPIFSGGVLNAVESKLILDNDFYINYQDAVPKDPVATIDNKGQSLRFNGKFNPTDPTGVNTFGTLRFAGGAGGETSLNNQVNLYGDLEVAEKSTLNITSSISEGITTPLVFLNGQNDNSNVDKFWRSSNNLVVQSGSVLRVTGHDPDNTYGPREPGEGNEQSIAVHRSPVINFNSGNDKFEIKTNGLAVVSFVNFLPSDYDLYRNNCRAGSTDETKCYKIVPQIDFGAGNDELVNDGVLVGPAEAPTGNFLELALRGGDDTITNNGYLGCLTGAADNGGWNGFKGQNTCSDADQFVGNKLPDDDKKDENRNYNINITLAGGNDTFKNYGYVRGSLNMGSDDDILYSSGGIRGGIVLGSGNDQLTIINDNSWDGSGVVDDYISLSTGRDAGTGNSEDVNTLLIKGNAVISFRNSLGFVKSGNCGTKANTDGGFYGCRWGEEGEPDIGYGYLAIAGSAGQDDIDVAPVDSSGDENSVAKIWGSVELGESTDTLKVQPNAHLDIVGDLFMGSDASQAITVDQSAGFSVRSIHGNVNFDISGTASLGGDADLGIFDADGDAGLKKGNTLSSYIGKTSVQEGGILRAFQAWSLSKYSSHSVDGELIIGDKGLREDQQIADLTGSGSVSVQNQSHLYYGDNNQDFEFSGTTSGNGSLVKEGTGIATISGTLGHTGFTKVHAGKLLLASGGALSQTSTALISSSDNSPILDLGGTSQDVSLVKLHGGTFRNGSLTADNVVTAERRDNKIDGVTSDDASVKATYSSEFNDDVSLTFIGSSEFKDLAINRATVTISPGSSLSLSEGINGSSSVLNADSEDLSLQDQLIVDGALTVGSGIELGAGNDLLQIGESGSIRSTEATESDPLVIDGGSGNTDVLLDLSGNYYSLSKGPDGFFVADNGTGTKELIRNFEVVGVKNQGVAYFGEKPSLLVTQSESSPPSGEYGLIMAAGNQLQTLTINSDGTVDTSTSAGAIAFGSNASKIIVPHGTLNAGMIYGDESFENSIELGSAYSGDVVRGALASVAKGKLEVGVLNGFGRIHQKGGIWSYAGVMDETDLLAQGIVRIEADESASFKSIMANERLGNTNTPLGVNGRSVIAVSGDLSISNGIQEQGNARASLLIADPDGENAHVYLDGESHYQGPTIVARGGSLFAKNGALSAVSKTLIGTNASIGIEGEQNVHRLIIRQTGKFTGGQGSKLNTKSIVNFGDIDLDSLLIEDGMTRFLDRYINFKTAKGELLPSNSPLRKVDAQGSLKNFGSVVLSGDLRFLSTGDAGGHALLNLSTSRNGQASIFADSIQFSDKNDVLINSGLVQTSGDSGIDFAGGNDLVLTKGTFSIKAGSLINGGEPLDISQWSPANRVITGLNIFKAYEDPGIDENDLKNWAAIKLGPDSDWQFPQAGECRVQGDGKIFTQDTFCVGLTGNRRNQTIVIEGSSQPTLDAGVIALGRGSSNTIEVRNGNLHAVLIEGAPGRLANSPNDRLFVGNNEGGSGELIVGAITGFDSMEQRGGTWSYAVNGVDDPEVKEQLMTSGRRTAEELDELGSFPEFSGYGVARVEPVVVTGRQKNQRTIQRAAFARMEGTNPEQPLQIQNIDAELEVTRGIHGNASLTTSGNTLLKGKSTYGGETLIQAGGELRAGGSLALSPRSDLTIDTGGVLDLDGYANQVPGLYGGSRSVADPGIIKLGANCADIDADDCSQQLPGGVLTVTRGDFAGTIEDIFNSQGAIVKIGTSDDELILSGVNQYFSPTFVVGGVLKAGADLSLSPNSRHVVNGGELDVRGYQQVISDLDIAGGVLRVESENPLDVKGEVKFSDGQIVAYLNNGLEDDGAKAPINSSLFTYVSGVERADPDHGIYAVVDPSATDNPDLNGTWKIISGQVNDIDALASNTFLVFPVTEGEDVDPDQVIQVGDQLYTVANFAGLNVPLEAASLKTVVLEEGSLNIIVKDKPQEEIVDDFEDDPKDRFGCEGHQELCEGFDESVARPILDVVLPIGDKLPLMHWGQLASLLSSGLSPRNVDAAPRGLQTYNNVLADTIFDRHPLRQFQPLLEGSSEESDSLQETESSVSEPVRGLWHKKAAMDEREAMEYLSDVVAENSVAASPVESSDQSYAITFDGLPFQEDQSLTAQYADRDGWRAWYRGFAANNRAYSYSTINNDYSLYTGGFALGADLSLSDSFQLGAYVNYGDVTAVQRGSTGGGSWSPDGWGGGITADYWTDNFYAQAIFGASGFSATQNRGIREIAEDWGGDTATAQKSAMSYLGALRLGAPFQAGSLLFEPQLTGIWTQNQENGFSESGVEKALRLKYQSRTTNYFQTGLGLKTAWPISSGDRAQWVPSIKLAWLADWNVGNQGQSIDYAFSDRSVSFLPEQQNQNGALIELGLDYSIANIESTSIKIYANGGAEIWGGERGTNWRASGGVTFQF